MVEPTGPPRTQLPGTSNAAEETKGENLTTYMVGDEAAFAADVRKRIHNIDMNMLEKGLLDRYLQD